MLAVAEPSMFKIISQYKSTETLAVPNIEDIIQATIESSKIDFIHYAKIHDTYPEDELQEVVRLLSGNALNHLLLTPSEHEVRKNLEKQYFSHMNQNQIKCAPVRKVW